MGTDRPLRRFTSGRIWRRAHFCRLMQSATFFLDYWKMVNTESVIVWGVFYATFCLRTENASGASRPKGSVLWFPRLAFLPLADWKTSKQVGFTLAFDNLRRGEQCCNICKKKADCVRLPVKENTVTVVTSFVSLKLMTNITVRPPSFSCCKRNQRFSTSQLSMSWDKLTMLIIGY